MTRGELRLLRLLQAGGGRIAADELHRHQVPSVVVAGMMERGWIVYDGLTDDVAITPRGVEGLAEWE